MNRTMIKIASCMLLLLCCHHLQRIESFLLSYRETLANFTSEELQSNVQAVRERLLEKPKNLDEVSGDRRQGEVLAIHPKY